MTVPASCAPAADPAPGREEPTVALVAPPSPAELVEGIVATWRASLVEAAGGSTLLDVEQLGDAVLDLSAAHPSGLAQLLAGRPTRLSSLVREGAALASARRHARAVAARATVYTQQYGIAPTSLAMGVATWTERTVPDVATEDVAALAAVTRAAGAGGAGATTAGSAGLVAGRDDGAAAGRDDEHGEDDEAAAAPTPAGPVERVMRAPVLLRPVTLRAKGAAESDYELSLEPTVEINPVLARALRSHGALLDPAALARGTFTDSGFDPHAALARLASLGWAVLEDFALTERVVVGTFVHPGQVLVDDLDALAGSVQRHEVLAALAGVTEVREAMQRPLPAPTRGDRDPALDRTVGDLDPAQQHLVDVVAGGGHVFVDAPAGTDITGTLAALVADAAAAGRTVLYVPGHRRAAAALADRLDRLGVGDLLLDVAPEAGWRSSATRRLLAAMTLEQSVVDERAAWQLRSELGEHREALRGYVRGLHAPRPPWGVSAYDALQELARLTSSRPTPRTTVRLAPDAARVLDAPARRRAGADLTRAAELGAFSLRPSDTPWYGADLRTPADAKAALARVERLLATLPEVMVRAGAVAADTGLTPPETVAGWSEQLRMLDEVRASLDVFQPLVFERTAADLVAATAAKDWRAEHGVEMGHWLRRRLRKQAKDMLRPGRPVADLHAALVDVQRRREMWQSYCPGGGWPRLPDGLEVVEADHAAVTRDLDALDAVLADTPDGSGLARLTMAELTERLTRLRAGAAALETLPARTTLLRHLRAAGLGELVDDLARRRVGAALVAAELDLAWWSTVLEQIFAADPALTGYDGATLDALSTRYAALDRAHVGGLSANVRNAVVKAMGAALRQNRDQAETLFGELIEERVTSVRDVMTRYPDVARRLRPVLSASPMIVPQVLPPSRTVDLVVLDAATRMPIEVVVSAIARGRQVVVVGDPRCSSGSAVRELAEVLPHLELHTDASRRDPWLTAFLVAHGYLGALVPTPLPAATPLVRLVQVDGTGLPGVESGIVDSTHEEVARVVEIVIEHALTHPDETLAVVTVTPRHADAVREQVLGEARANPALSGFFDPARPDPFVVVDLPHVAGLRRDALVLSLGLGRTPHRRVLHTFGPVSTPAGDAMLLDAIGCAQHRLTVVSSFAAGDMDPARLRGPGPRLLADLLAFAERRGRGDSDPLAPPTPQTPPTQQAPQVDGGGAEGTVPDEAPAETGAGAGTGIGAGSGTRIPTGSGAASDEGAEAAEVPAETARADSGIAGAAGEGSGAAAAPGGPVAPEDPDRLVLDLAERLWRHGLTVDVDHGIPGGTRIPLVVGHPDLPDRFLVAVLTDDQAYVDEPSVRVRDRLVPQRLERLGWSVLRVWSAAAFLDPEAEVDRIRRAVHAALPERATVPTSPLVVPRVLPESGELALPAADAHPAHGAAGTVPGAATAATARLLAQGSAGSAAPADEEAAALPDDAVGAGNSLVGAQPDDSRGGAGAGDSSGGSGLGGSPGGVGDGDSAGGAIDLDAAAGAPAACARTGSTDSGSGPKGGGSAKARAAAKKDARAAKAASGRPGSPRTPAPAPGATPAAPAPAAGSALPHQLGTSWHRAGEDVQSAREGAAGDDAATPPPAAPVRVATGVNRRVPVPKVDVHLSVAPAPRPRPDVRKGLPIGAYSDDQLDDVAAWLQADGTERTRDELADALRTELGLTRRNHRVDTAIRAAVSRAMR